MQDGITEHSPALRTRAVAALTRLYPFVSGRGLIANNPITLRLAGLPTGAVWARVAGGRMLAPLDDHVGRSAFFMGDLDPKLSWVIDRVVTPGDHVLDIGANLGLVTLRLGTRCGPSGLIHAFEPNPAAAALLRRTLAANPDIPARLHPFALGADAATLSLSAPAHNLGAGSLSTPGEEGARRWDVQVRRLDDCAGECGLVRADFVKIDVEGFEEGVLAGGAETLERLRPPVVVLEEHRAFGGTPPPPLKRLIDLGYALFAMPKTLLRPALVPIGRREAEGAHDYVAILSGAKGAAARDQLGVAG